MPLSEHLRLPLTRRFQASLAAVISRTAPAVQRAWDRLPNYDEVSVATLADRTSAPIGTAKSVSVRSAVGYYALLAGVRPPPIVPDEVAVDAEFRDPFIAVWTALAAGRSYEEAVLAGRARVEAVVANYANSTVRRTGDVFVAKADVTVHGWIRVPNSGACPWCLEIAPGHYKSADSADFGHDRCSCTAAPAF